MALQGNLHDFPIIQLLNLVHLAQKTGSLMVDKDGLSTTVVFRGGKLAFANSGGEEVRLLDVLLKTKKISPADFNTFGSRGQRLSDKQTGLDLINAGTLTQQEILACLQQYYSEVVYELFAWRDGAFRFESEIRIPDEKISIRGDLENLIMEGTRQIREQKSLEDEIPNLDVAMKFSERPGANIRKVNLNADEWRIVSFVNPKNSLRQIANATRLDEWQIRRVVTGLLQAGLVEIVRPAPKVSDQAPRIIPSASKEAQKSLLTRLMIGIRALRPQERK